MSHTASDAPCVTSLTRCARVTVIPLIHKQERSSVETHSILSSQNVHKLLKTPYEWWQDVWPEFDPIVQELTQSLLETSHCQAASIEFIATQEVLWGNLIHLLEQGQNYLGFFDDCYWFKTYYHVRFKVLTVVLLWIHVIWDTMLCCWATFDGNVIMQKHWQLLGQWQCYIPGDYTLQHTARLCYCSIKHKYGCQL